MTSSKATRAAWLASAAAIASSCPAGAQVGPPAAPAAATVAEQPGGVEDIVVTAQRRDENQQKVPIAVTLVSGAALDRANVTTLQDIGAIAPGLVATNDAGYGAAPLSIRGVGGANGGGNFFADEPVATYVDGAYVGRLSLATADLVDIDSIQVLRGPQGTLYGRNSTAGALLIQSRRPTDSFDLRGELGADTIGNQRVELAAGGPIVADQLAARFAIAYANHDGWGRNVVTGEHVHQGEDLTARLSLRWTPAADTRIDLIGEHRYQISEPALIRAARITGGLADSPFERRPDLRDALDHSRYAFDTPYRNRVTTDSATLNASFGLGGVTLTSITGYRTFNVDGGGDADNTAPADRTGGPVMSSNAARLRNDQFTQELRLASDGGAAAAFNWTAGGFYIHENNRVAPFVIDSISAFFGLGTHAVFNARQKLDAYAAFADASYRIVDGLTVRGGVRYSSESKDFTVTQRVVTLAGGFAPPLMRVVPAGFVVAAPPTFSASRKFKDTSLRGVIDYQVTPTILAYGSYSQGFKSGGFNAFGLNNGFDPEDIVAYEAGLKVQTADRLLRVNTAAFRYDYQNLQVRLPVPSGGVDIQNAANARIQGIEVEGTLVPLPGLNLSANVAYLHARFRDGLLSRVPAAARFRIGANIPLVQEDISGNRVSRAPDWQIAGTIDYSRPVGSSYKIGAGVSARYQTNVFYLETGQDQSTYRSGKWAEVGASLRFGTDAPGWTLSIYGDNLTDNRHFTAMTSLAGFPQGTINEPRRFGARLNVEY